MINALQYLNQLYEVIGENVDVPVIETLEEGASGDCVRTASLPKIITIDDLYRKWPEWKETLDIDTVDYILALGFALVI